MKWRLLVLSKLFQETSYLSKPIDWLSCHFDNEAYSQKKAVKSNVSASLVLEVGTVYSALYGTLIVLGK